jgi:hypothetical protein
MDDKSQKEYTLSDELSALTPKELSSLCSGLSSFVICSLKKQDVLNIENFVSNTNLGSQVQN